jgi:hypothetical protein
VHELKKKTRSHLKILGTKLVTRSKFHTGDAQLLGANVYVQFIRHGDFGTWDLCSPELGMTLLQNVDSYVTAGVDSVAVKWGTDYPWASYDNQQHNDFSSLLSTVQLTWGFITTKSKHSACLRLRPKGNKVSCELRLSPVYA